MKIKPLNNIILAKIVEKEEKKENSNIYLPDSQSVGKIGRFVRLAVLDVGNTVEIIKKGDEVIANNLFELIDPLTKEGFINSKDVLGIIK